MKRLIFEPVKRDLDEDAYTEPVFVLPARSPKAATIAANFFDATNVQLEDSIDGEIGTYAKVVPYYEGIAELFCYK